MYPNETNLFTAFVFWLAIELIIVDGLNSPSGLSKTAFNILFSSSFIHLLYFTILYKSN